MSDIKEFPTDMIAKMRANPNKGSSQPDETSELAELRAENERLQESEKAIIGCARTWKARAEKAEAELERALADAVALWRGLENIKSFYFVDATNEDGKRRIILAYRGDPDIAGVVFDPEYDAFELAEETERWLSDKIQKLLASPDPGERVRAVVEAAKQHFERFKGMHEISCPICEAVHALRGKEGEEDA